MKDIMPHEGRFVMSTLTYGSLGEVISKETISIHHGKHLKAYVDNLNKLLPDSGFEGLALQDVVRRCEDALFNPEVGPGHAAGSAVSTNINTLNAIRNNAGQVLNHMLYFEQFSLAPRPMSTTFASMLERDFGSVETFKKEFEQCGATLFGSGWVWLSKDKDDKLVIAQHKNAENPVARGLKPLLTFDVWEHAYYLDYQNRRADYLAALWQVVDWTVVENRL